MQNKLIILLFLLIFWWAFSGEGETFFLVAGAFSCLFALYIATRMGLQNKIIHNSKIVRYLLWLTKEIFLSGIYVTRLVWAKDLKLLPEFVTVEAPGAKDVFFAMYANSITMTPGTVAVIIDENHGKVITHAISKKTAGDLKAGIMAKKINEVLK